MSDNVTSIFPAMRKKEQEDDKKIGDMELSIEEIAAKNEAIEIRMKEERRKANKSVLKSYRIKK